MAGQLVGLVELVELFTELISLSASSFEVKHEIFNIQTQLGKSVLNEC